MDKESSLNWKEMKKDDILEHQEEGQKCKTMDTSYTMNNTSSSLVFQIMSDYLGKDYNTVWYGSKCIKENI